MSNQDGAERLLPAERRRRIAAIVAGRGGVRLDELAREVGVSVDTARRDVDGLHDAGVIERTRGGAVARVQRESIVPLDDRIDRQNPGKQAIARAAARLIGDGSSLVINGGSTTLAFAEALASHRGLSIVTNNLRIPSALARSAVHDLYVLGGRVHPDVGATVGSGVFRGEAPVACDVAVVSVGGIAARRGLSMADPEEATLTSEMIAASARAVVLCDATKFGREALMRVSDLHTVTVLVTDAEPPVDLREALREAGTELVVARRLNPSPA